MLIFSIRNHLIRSLRRHRRSNLDRFPVLTFFNKSFQEEKVALQAAQIEDNLSLRKTGAPELTFGSSTVKHSWIVQLEANPTALIITRVGHVDL